MKMGMRKPSIKRSIKARTTGKVKRAVKRTVNPMYGKKGMGIVNDPKKAVYNKVYNKTTFGVSDIVSQNDSSVLNTSGTPIVYYDDENGIKLVEEFDNNAEITASSLFTTLLFFGIILLLFAKVFSFIELFCTLGVTFGSICLIISVISFFVWISEKSDEKEYFAKLSELVGQTVDYRFIHDAKNIIRVNSEKANKAIDKLFKVSNYSAFFENLEIYYNALNTMIAVEPLFIFPEAKPSEAKKYAEEQHISRVIIDKYYNKYSEKINTLVTKKGKENNANKFYSELSNYKEKLSEEDMLYAGELHKELLKQVEQADVDKEK